jgi:hypothetical protein
MEDVGLFCGHLVYFYGQSVYLSHCTKKNLPMSNTYECSRGALFYHFRKILKDRMSRKVPLLQLQR